jgi:acetyl-CoA acetyltransferase
MRSDRLSWRRAGRPGAKSRATGGVKGGCDARIAAMTINKVCGSGLAVALAAQAVNWAKARL